MAKRAGSGYTTAISLPPEHDETRPSPTRRRGRAALVLGLAALGLALGAILTRTPPPRRQVTLTAGFLDTTRAQVARTMVGALARDGVEAKLVETTSTQNALEQVDRGEIDLALVSGTYRIERHPRVRAVTPLYVEALHLVVKEELAAAVTSSLDALQGHSIDLGPHGSTTNALARAVLDFAGVSPGGAVPAENQRALTPPELLALVARNERAALPDAVFHLATTPSKVALELIRGARYRLIPLPFAEAFRLATLLTDDLVENPESELDRRDVSDTTIPAFTYEIDPPIPSEPLHTIGSRLMLVANEAVPPETVDVILDTVFSASVAQMTSPALEPAVLQLPSRVRLHDGTLAHLRRGQPYVTNDTVDALSNSLSILGALVGAALFLWQWWRQRTRAHRDETFASYVRRLADVERRMAAFELSATLELEPLAALQRELLELKSEALDRFAAGDLGDQAAIADLLSPINAARDHVGDLLLHVRDNLEQRADAEGRTTTAVWAEAIERP